jgi:hypothetical protein
MEAPSPPRVVVLLEGQSDVVALRTLATARGLDEADPALRLVPMGGVTNIRRHLDTWLRQSEPPRVLGLCDAGEADHVQRALSAHGLVLPDPEAMGAVGFHVCTCDLEDELIRALGADRTLAVLDDLALGDRFATLQRQPAWRGKPLQSQLRRFAGVASGRKALLDTALAAALTAQQVPRPLARLLDQVESALGQMPRRTGISHFNGH